MYLQNVTQKEPLPGTARNEPGQMGRQAAVAARAAETGAVGAGAARSLANVRWLARIFQMPVATVQTWDR